MTVVSRQVDQICMSSAIFSRFLSNRDLIFDTAQYNLWVISFPKIKIPQEIPL